MLRRFPDASSMHVPLAHSKCSIREFPMRRSWHLQPVIRGVRDVQNYTELMPHVLREVEHFVSVTRAISATKREATSVITLNPAIRDRVKSGHREWPKT
jgi:hypothetical protein